VGCLNPKKGVQRQDGKPFTADDVVFNWEFGRSGRHDDDLAPPATSKKVEKTSDLSVKITFAAHPVLAIQASLRPPFTLIPWHHFEA
jgi:peptide/nickel transport system substrate-binding protein